MKKRLQEYSLVLIGTTMAAAAFGMFILPEGFLAGGVTGSARLIASSIGLPVSLIVLIINVALLLMGLIVMGKQFVVKSVFSSFYFPLALEITQHIKLPLETIPVPVAALLAGVILGTGGALVIRGKGSEGGYDIIAIIMNAKLGVPISAVVNGIDAVLIICQISGGVFSRIAGGLLTIGICAASMHLALNGVPALNKKRDHCVAPAETVNQ